jgi:hypothetical protein
MVLINEGGGTRKLSELLFPFDEVNGPILGWVGLKLKKSS